MCMVDFLLAIPNEDGWVAFMNPLSPLVMCHRKKQVEVFLGSGYGGEHYEKFIGNFQLALERLVIFEKPIQ